jgi:hypothetical protein
MPVDMRGTLTPRDRGAKAERGALARGVHLNPLMKSIISGPRSRNEAEEGKVGWALAWLLGIPLPVLLIVWLFTKAC